MFFEFVARLKRRILTSDEVEKYKVQTPPVKKGSSRLFRNLRDKGRDKSLHKTRFNF